MGLLEGRSALITGAGSGIGRAAAIVLGREGARLALGDIAESALAETARLVGAAAAVTTHAVDVTDREQVRRFVATAIERHDGLDCAFNNAGVNVAVRPLAEQPDADYERIMAVNVGGVWNCLQEEIPPMVEAGGGAIVNTASCLAAVAAPGQGAYVASKHAVLGLTRSAALDYATAGLRVNAVMPGIVETPMVEPQLNAQPQMRRLLEREVPVGRLCTPAEVGEAVAWLCSDRASYITGSGVAVDGGLTTW
jgi:NAD(P)-dependent dehydrogenase (short-subunit alcohol dehydrogenase family)